VNRTLLSERLERARDAMAGLGADWLIVPPSADFLWLTGAHARSTERLLALAIPRAGEPFCIVPRLEAEALAHECPELDLLIWDEHEDAFEHLTARLRLGSGATVLVAEGLRVTPLLRLAGLATCRPATECLGPLRAIKEADEIAHLATAARHADDIVEAAADFARPGMREREVARFIVDRFEAAGDTDPWVIVGSGPHSALPHHATSDRALAEGEALLIDCGASTSGYGSDITRTYWLGAPSDEAVRVHATVDRARAAGIAAVHEGALPEEVDRAARAVIEAAGYGEYFTHRTGHGVGLDIHEPPWIVAGNRAPLAAGMVHSIEPGIYLPGRFGVRLEDLVVVEGRAARPLNRAPRDLRPPRLRG
jgi:D-alanyl-D-alanine dipeptidase